MSNFQITSNRIHASNPLVTFSSEVSFLLFWWQLTLAQKATKDEELFIDELLVNRKLYLVLDLDQTILHAIYPEPEYRAVIEDYQKQGEDIRDFFLGEAKYFVRFRPGIQQFLEAISPLYDIHVYTAGTREYAEKIVGKLDEYLPEGKKLFSGQFPFPILLSYLSGNDLFSRIMTRDESKSTEVKNLSFIMPRAEVCYRGLSIAYV